MQPSNNQPRIPEGTGRQVPTTPISSRYGVPAGQQPPTNASADKYGRSAQQALHRVKPLVIGSFHRLESGDWSRDLEEAAERRVEANKKVEVRQVPGTNAAVATTITTETKVVHVSGVSFPTPSVQQRGPSFGGRQPVGGDANRR